MTCAARVRVDHAAGGKVARRRADVSSGAGIARIRRPGSDSALGPWTKFTKGPILKPSEAVSGPGHHCFIESPDGKELFIAYHVHRDPNNGRGERVLAIDRARIVGEGSETTIKVDGPTSTPQPMPSGSARAKRPS